MVDAAHPTDVTSVWCTTYRTACVVYYDVNLLSKGSAWKAGLWESGKNKVDAGGIVADTWGWNDTVYLDGREREWNTLS